MNLDELTIILGDGTKIELESAFVGGRLKDITNAPMGMYSGKMNFDSAATSLIHLLRAAIKLCTEEMGMNHHMANDFLHFCAEKATEIEIENNPDNNQTIADHEIYLKMKQDKPND
jgi:hypothetical protein